MSNYLQKKDSNSLALEIHNPQKNEKAIDLRRKMAEIPEVAMSLTKVEKLVFVSSTKKQISEIPTNELVEKTAQMFMYISRDVGLVIPSDSDDWAYTCARWMEVLQNHYANLTLAEVKLAFELAAIGDLNEFLPKNKDGAPDKNHYQQFSIEYLSKILNAYKQKQSVVINKAYKALPNPGNKITIQEINRLHNVTLDGIKEIFVKYKESGDLEIKPLQYMFVYDWMKRVGLSPGFNIEKEDREKAYHRFIVRSALFTEKKYEVQKLKKEGFNSELIDFTAVEVAREKEILSIFDKMVTDSVDINKHLDYRNEDY